MLAFLIDQQAGESAMRWAVRLAVVFCLLRAWLVLRNPDRSRIPTKWECWLWTIGWTSYAAHVILAFQFVHDWSHADAWQHTAIETERMTRIRRGEGLWVNYLFTAMWLADVVRIWTACRRRVATNRTLDVVNYFFFAFIVFNATVVFGPAIYRWLAIPVAVWLSRTWYQARLTPLSNVDASSR